MKRKGLIAATLFIALLGCNGQTKSEKKLSDKETKPQTNIKVNKEYDKDGNLLSYDSTYSSVYSSIEDNKNLRDSILNEFKGYINRKYSFSDEPIFNDFFFEDSLMKYDFYKSDFFLKRFRNNVAKMDSLFRGMDSMKNDFFKSFFDMPGVLEAPKN